MLVEAISADSTAGLPTQINLLVSPLQSDFSEVMMHSK
jgi:hypothetical protein